MIFDFEDLDSDSIIGFGNLLIELLRRSLNPVIVPSMRLLAFIEDLYARAGTEVCIFAGNSRRGGSIAIHC